MPAFVVQIDGYDPVGAAAVTLYAASIDDERVCSGLNGQSWWPVIAELPKLRYDLVDAGFGGQIATPTSSLVLGIEPWPNLGRYALGDARVRMWSAEPGTAWGSWTLRFDGRCKAQPSIAEGRATLTIGVDDGWLDTPLLTLYAGTTGIEGDAGLKGQPKPLALGAPRYCPGALIDNANIVFQLSAYGAINDVGTAFEGLASFGASAGDYASYAALVAATIKAGQWATSKAAGLVRHGAPPAPSRRFCYHVNGDQAGSGGWVRLPGAIIRRIAILAGGTGKTNDANLAALDTARPWNISWHIREQITAREAIQRIAASVNAMAGVSWTSQLFVAPIPDLTGAATITLDSGGTSLPPVAKVEQLEIDPPYWRMAIQAERTEQVAEYSEIAFTAVLVDRGTYDATQSYREGHLVQDQGTTWLYINPTPSIGNAPPTLPTVSNSFWKALGDPGSSIVVTPSAANFRTTDNVYNPSSQTINFTAALYNLSGTVSWTAKNPAGTAVKSGTGTSFSLAQSDMGTNLSLVVTATCGWASSQPLTIGVVDDSTAAAGATAGRNMILNPGAETGAVAPWALDTTVIAVAGTGWVGTFVPDTTSPPEGKYRFALTKGATSQATVVMHPALAVKPGEVWTFRATLQGSGATASGLYFRINQSATSPASGYVGYTESGSWANVTDLLLNGPVPASVTLYEYQYTVPAGVYFVSPAILAWVNSPNIYFDEIEFFRAADFATAVTGGTKPENSADVTRILTVSPSLSVAYDYTGTTSTQLPVTLHNKMVKSGVDVTSSTSWSYTASGCTVTTSGMATGDVSLTAVSATNASILVSATIDGVTRTDIIAITRTLGQAPAGGGGGGTFPSSYSEDASATITATSYTTVNVLAASAQIQSNGSGQIRAVLNGSYNVYGSGRTAQVQAKLQQSTNNSTWTDSGLSTTGTTADGGTGSFGSETDGAIAANSLVSGFTASTNYYLRWVAIAAFSGTSSVGVSGTASGAQS